MCLDSYARISKQTLGDDAGAAAAFQQVMDARGGEVSETAITRAKALRAMGQDAEAEVVLTAMLEKATARLAEQAKQGFATSVPEFVFAEADMGTRRRTHLTYLIGLAQLGLGQTAEARVSFESVLEMSPGHVDAQTRLRELG